MHGYMFNSGCEIYVLIHVQWRNQRGGGGGQGTEKFLDPRLPPPNEI